MIQSDPGVFVEGFAAFASDRVQKRKIECRIIGLRRARSTHLHRPWRATAVYAIAAESRRLPIPRVHLLLDRL
ncbi:MAG TPA: hypothetical protein VK621_26955 [Bradyrhizobium sp.]|nr:hypothetical protein [Bradyrhizobium sp.]